MQDSTSKTNLIRSSRFLGPSIARCSRASRTARGRCDAAHVAARVAIVALGALLIHAISASPITGHARDRAPTASNADGYHPTQADT